MTDLVRAFGYDELSRDEAQRRLKPLVETYGAADIGAAVDEIIELTGGGSVWRLTEQARKLAVQILGRPKSVQETAQSNVAPAVKPTKKKKGK